MSSKHLKLNYSDFARTQILKKNTGTKFFGMRTVSHYFFSVQRQFLQLTVLNIGTRLIAKELFSSIRNN
jgi:hypothetical protein